MYVNHSPVYCTTANPPQLTIIRGSSPTEAESLRLVYQRILFLPKVGSQLSKDVCWIADIFSGYDQYFTGRTYLVKLGDWRNNKDEEIELDGIGGVNILVKADVHRSGKS